MRQRESTLERVDELRPRYPDLLGDLGLGQPSPPPTGLNLGGDRRRQDMAREMRQAGDRALLLREKRSQRRERLSNRYLVSFWILTIPSIGAKALPALEWLALL